MRVSIYAVEVDVGKACGLCVCVCSVDAWECRYASVRGGSIDVIRDMTATWYVPTLKEGIYMSRVCMCAEEVTINCVWVLVLRSCMLGKCLSGVEVSRKGCQEDLCVCSGRWCV